MRLALRLSKSKLFSIPIFRLLHHLRRSPIMKLIIRKIQLILRTNQIQLYSNKITKSFNLHKQNKLLSIIIHVFTEKTVILLFCKGKIELEIMLNVFRSKAHILYTHQFIFAHLPVLSKIQSFHFVFVLVIFFILFYFALFRLKNLTRDFTQCSPLYTFKRSTKLFDLRAISKIK